MLEQIAKRSVLEGNTKLSLPVPTGLGIPRISNEFVVRPLSRKLRAPKIVLDDASQIQVALDVRNRGEPERFRRANQRSRRRNGHGHGRKSSAGDQKCVGRKSDRSHHRRGGKGLSTLGA